MINSVLEILSPGAGASSPDTFTFTVAIGTIQKVSISDLTNFHSVHLSGTNVTSLFFKTGATTPPPQGPLTIEIAEATSNPFLVIEMSTSSETIPVKFSVPGHSIFEGVVGVQVTRLSYYRGEAIARIENIPSEVA